MSTRLKPPPRLRAPRPQISFVPYRPVLTEPYLLPIPGVYLEMHELHEFARHRHRKSGRQFPMSGRLVSEIGQELAEDYYGLLPAVTVLEDERIVKHTKGVDLTHPDGRLVQVRSVIAEDPRLVLDSTDTHVDHLLFMQLDFEEGYAIVHYNGPMAPLLALQTRSVSLSRLEALSEQLRADQQFSRTRF